MDIMEKFFDHQTEKLLFIFLKNMMLTWDTRALVRCCSSWRCRNDSVPLNKMTEKERLNISLRTCIIGKNEFFLHYINEIGQFVDNNIRCGIQKGFSVRLHGAIDRLKYP